MFRNRGLVQYFSPYISADLSKMALSFNTTIPNLVRNDLAMHLSAFTMLSLGKRVDEADSGWVHSGQN